MNNQSFQWRDTKTGRLIYEDSVAGIIDPVVKQALQGETVNPEYTLLEKILEKIFRQDASNMEKAKNYRPTEPYQDKQYNC